jgi:hypothetical protein
MTSSDDTPYSERTSRLLGVTLSRMMDSRDGDHRALTDPAFEGWGSLIVGPPGDRPPHEHSQVAGLAVHLLLGLADTRDDPLSVRCNGRVDVGHLRHAVAGSSSHIHYFFAALVRSTGATFDGGATSRWCSMDPIALAAILPRCSTCFGSSMLPSLMRSFAKRIVSRSSVNPFPGTSRRITSTSCSTSLSTICLTSSCDPSSSFSSGPS